MRVIAGTARSVPLRTLKGMDVRPTTDRTKETLFNILQFRIPGCRFLDLYAGSGSIGIEALSRGDGGAFFVEKDRRVQKLIAENLEHTKLADRGEIVRGDVRAALPLLTKEGPFDIIFMDPPFGQGLEKDTLMALPGLHLLREGGLIVVEAAPKTDFSFLGELPYQIDKEKIYGQSMHLFLSET